MMTMIDQCYFSNKNTSAFGSITSQINTDFLTTPSIIPLLGELTMDTGSQAPKEISLSRDHTSAAPPGCLKLHFKSSDSVTTAIMEIRRRSGLTWHELGDLFNVSRHCVYRWINSGTINARHDSKLHQILEAIRRIDTGDSTDTRTLLFTVDRITEESIFNLLRSDRVNEAVNCIENMNLPPPKTAPLFHSNSTARRPPAPWLLLEAEYERPKFPANARAVRAVRTSTTTD